MTSSTPSLESCPLGADLVAPEQQPARLLPSGRSVVVRVAAGGDEELEVRRLDGTLEVRIRLTADGPVLQLQGTRLELEAADVVAVQCRRFEVRTTEDIDLRSSGDVNIAAHGLTAETEDDLRLTGKIIRLNC